MSNQISSAVQPPGVDQITAAQAKATEANAAQTPQTSKTAPAPQAAKTAQAPTDTVQISSASKAILQEVQETHAQTVKEANGGDAQAKRLLAKEAAAVAQVKK
jgi:hypothetical protein